ncbi:hypothetical protein, partial [Pseudomonas amygdali]|uniref:hypothetical protein n=1 Tax=Pseudomonas amygdali TaxID=47877 RepID=UPI001E5E1195
MFFFASVNPTVVPKLFSHRATLRVACRSGRSASGLAFVVRIYDTFISMNPTLCDAGAKANSRLKA